MEGGGDLYAVVGSTNQGLYQDITILYLDSIQRPMLAAVSTFKTTNIAILIGPTALVSCFVLASIYNHYICGSVIL